MIYKLKDNGQQLIPILNIESLVVTDDIKSAVVFRNVLFNALTSGKIMPRNEYGFQINLASHYQINEDTLEEITQKTVRALSRPRSITDFVRDVDPIEVKRLARLDMKRFNAEGMKQAVLMCYLIKEDVAGLLAEHGITCEWVTSEPDGSEKLPKNELGMVLTGSDQTHHALNGEIDASDFPSSNPPQPKRENFSDTSKETEPAITAKVFRVEPLWLEEETGVSLRILKELENIIADNPGEKVIASKVHRYFKKNIKGDEKLPTLHTIESRIGELKKKGRFPIAVKI